MDFDHTKLADRLLPAAIAAGAAILRHRRVGFAVESKADRSPVTAADREAEEIILEALQRAAPGVPVVAEEAMSRGDRPAIGSTFFLVDALDGTREFVAGGAEFTVNIALVVGRTPQFGIVYAPALSQLYFTLGADSAASLSIPPDVEPTSVFKANATHLHTREPDPERLVSVNSRSHRTAEDDRFQVDPRIASTRTIGSSLKFCLVAKGEADIYPRFGATNEWDTAAGHAIVLAAGGLVTTFEKEPLLYGKADANFVNPPFVAWARPSLAETFRL